MSAIAITRCDWIEFFHSFSGLYRGRSTMLEVLGGSADTQVVRARRIPLERITVELDDDGEDRIILLTQASTQFHIVHVLASPSRVELSQTREGAESLEIECHDGTAMRLVLAKTVDATEPDPRDSVEPDEAGPDSAAGCPGQI